MIPSSPICGTATREIPLTKGRAAIVDAADFDWLSEHKWSLNRGSADRQTAYAVHHCKIAGQRRIVTMHRLIIGAKPGQLVDHINGDGLDNRRANLRLCNHTQNMRNRRVARTNKTGFKGVLLAEGRYRVSITEDGRQVSLGGFGDPITAARAYDLGAIERFGEFARLNFSLKRDWLFPHETTTPWPPNLDLFERP